MSAYEVSRFLHDVAADGTLRATAQSDPAAALQRYELDADERALLLDGQVGALHQRGVHALLLSRLVTFKLFGMTLDTYVDRITASHRDSPAAGED